MSQVSKRSDRASRQALPCGFNAGAHDEDDPLLLLLPEVVLPEPLLLPLELRLELRPRMRPFFSCMSHPSSTH